MTDQTGASASAIQHHYDAGNEFFALWLDRTMTYSAAMWDEGDDGDLSTAQMRKIDWHLQQVRIRPGARLLDVGCGWGSLLRRAVDRFHVAKAVGLSLSEAQTRWINECRGDGLEVRIENWQEHRPEQSYDAIISIGAFEHFARLDQSPAEKAQGYRKFAEFCHGALAPKGRLSLQSIVYETADRTSFSPFFASEVFPESDLPHLAEIVACMRGLFEIELVRNDRHDYARTLRRWLANLRDRRGRAIAAAGKEHVEKYEKYLGMMIIAFHTGSMNLSRVVCRRIDSRGRAIRV